MSCSCYLLLSITELFADHIFLVLFKWISDCIFMACVFFSICMFNWSESAIWDPMMSWSEHFLHNWWALCSGSWCMNVQPCVCFLCMSVQRECPVFCTVGRWLVRLHLQWQCNGQACICWSQAWSGHCSSPLCCTPGLFVFLMLLALLCLQNTASLFKEVSWILEQIAWNIFYANLCIN